MIKEQQFSVSVSAVSLLTPSGHNAAALKQKEYGRIVDFKARKRISDRKNIKLMTRSVRLGVACIEDAVSKVPHWQDIPPEKRGVFVGASPQIGRHEDFQYAIDASYSSGQFSVTDFAEKGIAQIHPLWLIRGLSNNVLGFGSAHHNVQGCNMNYAMGEEGGWNAIVEALHALQEERVDIVIAGGADDMTGVEEILVDRCSEAAAFLVFERGETVFRLQPDVLQERVAHFGHLGAAKWPVAIALQEFANCSSK